MKDLDASVHNKPSSSKNGLRPVHQTASRGAASALVVMLACGIAMYTTGSGVMPTVLVLAVQLCATLYAAIVVWNPSVHSLVTGQTPVPSSAAVVCRADPDPEANNDGEATGDPPTAGEYYAEYHGHRVEHIARVHARLPAGRKIYLMGDSSLDNKHWFFDASKMKEMQMQDPSFTAPAVNGYEAAFRGRGHPRMVKDVCFHLNDLAAERLGPGKVCTVMTSIEESTIQDRIDHGLLAQDVYIRDNIRPDDFLIVSMGGNDIALRPTLRTAVNMAMLTRSPSWLIRIGMAPGMGYFLELLRDRIQEVLLLVTAKQRPAKVLVSILYYPGVSTGTGSWADPTLAALGYNDAPEKLQLIIRTLISRIKATGGLDIPGTDVGLVPLYELLDPNDPNDYEQRVEPSVGGGRKMAAGYLDALGLTAERL